MDSSIDCRGVARGACTTCRCASYIKPSDGNSCDYCGHAPAIPSSSSTPPSASPVRLTVPENGGWPSPSSPSVATSSSISADEGVSSHCEFPGCTRKKYREGDRLHDYCGRTHAQEARRLGLLPQSHKEGHGRKAKPSKHARRDEHYFTDDGAGKEIEDAATASGWRKRTPRLSRSSESSSRSSSPLPEFLTVPETSSFPNSPRPQQQQNRNPYGGNAICFYHREEPFFEFTNFAEFPIVVKDVQWPTTEHFIQAQKFTDKKLKHIADIWIPEKLFSELFENRERLQSLQMWKHPPPGPFDPDVMWRTYRSMSIAELIRGLPSARSAFDLARQLDPLKRHDWDEIKVNRVMKPALWAKFTQYNELRDLLLSTGDKLLVEHTSNDKFWGDGGGPGRGQNQLGRLLMRIRDSLRQGETDANWDEVHVGYRRRRSRSLDPPAMSRRRHLIHNFGRLVDIHSHK